MKALTIWQPWATLIAEGAKPYEFRKWPAPDWIIGEQIVIHAAARPVRPAEVDEIIWRMVTKRGAGLSLDWPKAAPLLDQIKLAPKRLPLGCGLCLATLSASIRVTELPEVAGMSAAERAEIDPNMWAWKLENIIRFEPPEPRDGQQGFWNWKE